MRSTRSNTIPSVSITHRKPVGGCWREGEIKLTFLQLLLPFFDPSLFARCSLAADMLHLLSPSRDYSVHDGLHADFLARIDRSMLQETQGCEWMSSNPRPTPSRDLTPVLPFLLRSTRAPSFFDPSRSSPTERITSLLF